MQVLSDRFGAEPDNDGNRPRADGEPILLIEKKGDMFLISIKFNFFVLGVAIVCAACTGKTGTPEDALFAKEALIRYQMTHNYAATKDDVDIFCVEISNVFDRRSSSKMDPPAILIERLNDGRRKVRKGSDCAYDEDSGVFEKSSNSPALILVVGEHSWDSATSMTITGGYYEGSLSASGSTYQLEKRDDKWEVTKDELGWIS
ncbi:hypothetical protein [Janthinobacterium sp. AD80]|uniref:hypothetical protein n=1 Tax=Janthinobacterium sp. AD80 TaxID=1528773 RepID=UPI000C860BF1|nr:hypothetical protein [Janthinobacterium sp. AD80]PMQ18452.1 hypothetical protein JaAD80_00650 [Janthinobacterium sp. AD80]